MFNLQQEIYPKDNIDFRYFYDFINNKKLFINNVSVINNNIIYKLSGEYISDQYAVQLLSNLFQWKALLKDNEYYIFYRYEKNIYVYFNNLFIYKNVINKLLFNESEISLPYDIYKSIVNILTIDLDKFISTYYSFKDNKFLIDKYNDINILVDDISNFLLSEKNTIHRKNFKIIITDIIYNLIQ